MAKLKLGALVDDKPVRITVELPAATQRDLVAYAQILAAETGDAVDPVKLIPAMLARFMGTDRAFGKARRSRAVPSPSLAPHSETA